MPLTVGQVGARNAAAAHLAAFVRHPQVTQVRLADPCAEAREALVREFGIIKHACEDYRELLDDAEVDLISVCTPNALRATQCIEAMQAGKHVVVQAPPALTLDQCDAMLRVSRETDRRLFCVLSHRMLPAHLRARELLEAGEIGRPLLAQVTVLADDLDRMNDPEDWRGDWERAGGGVLLEEGYHAVTVLQHLLGPPRAVTAITRRLVVDAPNKAEDTCALTLEMPEGVLASVVITCAAAGDRRSEERRLVGTEGSLLIRDDPEDEMPLVAFHGGDFVPLRIHNPPRVHHYATRETVSHFIDCMGDEREPEITFREARAAVATIAAAYEADREGRIIRM